MKMTERPARAFAAACACTAAMLQGCGSPGLDDRRVSSVPPPLPASVVASTAATGSSSRVISPGPTYYGANPVRRVSVYLFLDFRTEYVNAAFREAFGRRLATALLASAVPSQAVWFTDTRTGQALMADIAGHTFSNSTSIPVGRTIVENRPNEAPFAPTHRLVVFPTRSVATGDSGTLELKWDVRDLKTDYVEWSVYTQTTRLSARMSAEQADEAAGRLADAIAAELRARSVVPSSGP